MNRTLRLKPLHVARESQQFQHDQHDRRLRRRLGHILPMSDALFKA
jgi:hypothetical protein